MARGLLPWAILCCIAAVEIKAVNVTERQRCIGERERCQVQGWYPCCTGLACQHINGHYYTCERSNTGKCYNAGEACSTYRKCCSGLKCGFTIRGYKCKQDDQCRQEDQSCSDSNTCCQGLECQNTWTGRKCKQPEQCRQEDQSCSDSNTCCQGLECQNTWTGRKCKQPDQQCRVAGQACSSSGQSGAGVCCSGLICSARQTCMVDWSSGCRKENQQCFKNAEPGCCSGLACVEKGSISVCLPPVG